MAEEKGTFKWVRPEEVMKIHQLKKKKNALQKRMCLNKSSSHDIPHRDTSDSVKRKNPFALTDSCKRSKTDEPLDSENTLFKILHCSSHKASENRITFTNILSQETQVQKVERTVEVVRGEKWIPVDWTLKTKVRFLSTQSVGWSQKLKISEEASALTGFSRCLDTSTTETSLDTSPNAKFHQCCLYWQQPCLPWLSLFPRTSGKITNSIPSIATNQTIRESLHLAFTDGLKSLFQLLRTRQCPYFYVCTNSFTVLFRAAGISGFSEMNVMITPTTRGFRHVLRQEDIEFVMPLKKNRISDQSSNAMDSASNSGNKEEESWKEIDEDELTNEEWLKDMGITAEDIKKINFTQERIELKTECGVDNSDESLVLIEGHEVPGFFNFLMNCKSVIPQIGTLAGIPPTLLAPVAFNGGSVNSLRIRENKVHVDNENFHSIELIGPILPHMIHNLYHLCQPEVSVTASFNDFKSTQPFSKVKFKAREVDEQEKEVDGIGRSGSQIFKKENLADCGFNSRLLDMFCSEDPNHTINYECLKYCSKLKMYNWL